LHPIALTADAFSLRPGATKFLRVASYDERRPDGSAAAEVNVHTPAAFFGVVVPADKSHTLRLRATSIGGVYLEATCRLFVQNGRHRLEER
jgi:hypothetical protein